MSLFPHSIENLDTVPSSSRPKPQLQRFRSSATKAGSNLKIKYLELLGSSVDDESAESGADGHVFKVTIHSKLYALKIFRFYDPEEARSQLTNEENESYSDAQIVEHTDPFFAECRAYGRIADKSKTRKRAIAVPCHGFISIPAAKEEFFEETFGIDTDEWKRQDWEYSFPASDRQPFRAIVKDFVAEDPELTNSVIKSMLRELKALNSIGIYVRDVRYPNYKGGHLVDFGSAITTPHLLMREEFRSRKSIARMKLRDLYAFDDMIEDLGIETDVIAAPLKERLASLRKRPLR